MAPHLYAPGWSVVAVAALLAIAAVALHRRRHARADARACATCGRCTGNRGDGEMYETKRILNEYLAMHYAPPGDLLAYSFGPHDALDFPRRCAELCHEFARERSDARVLDVGCAVGGATFLLARWYETCIGIDYSQAFVDAASRLREAGSLDYDLVDCLELRRRATAVVDPRIDRRRVHFLKGDACALPTTLGTFDIVLAANLVCRLYDPVRFLHSVRGLVKPGGIVVITSPYTFSVDYTPRDRMLGGFMRDGQPVTGLDGLRDGLGPSFTLIARRDMAFFIRETARKNQWTVAEATVWRLRSA